MEEVSNLYIISDFTYAAKDEDFPIGQDIDLRRGDIGGQHTGMASTAPVLFFLGIDILFHSVDHYY